MCMCFFEIEGPQLSFFVKMPQLNTILNYIKIQIQHEFQILNTISYQTQRRRNISES